MRLLPIGTVTFLFTDIQGSTRLWQADPDLMGSALARHDHLLREAITENGGYVFKTVGDAFCAAFTTAPTALAAALSAQRSLAAEPWPMETPIRVRMALHTGAAEERDGDYYGPPLNRVARLLATGHGGQTLLSNVTQGLTCDFLPPTATLLNLGQHRLKDLGRPEQIFQLQHPDLPVAFPPLKSLDNPRLPNNLPQQPSSFIGRETVVAEVKKLLVGTRLLTLVGAGGSGKTRLSLQVAADLLDGEGDGVWLVELAPLSDPTLVPSAVAQVLGVPERAGKPLIQTLVEWLRPKGLLLVLDNCEHLVSACATLAAELLRNCPGVSLLASSREPLNVVGEQTYRVPSLSMPDPKQSQTAEGLSQYEAVCLFIERAKAVQPAFAVSDANAPALAHICFQLDGIPLAIELAAARVRSLPVEEINARLDDRFRLLTGGSRTVLPRQQTLRALVDWSYDLLTEQEQMLLRRLSVFAGGWTLAAAEAVCADEGIECWEILDLLSSLVDKSLVSYEGERGRYRLLETVRRYADRRFDEQARTLILERHLSWCLALSEKADAGLDGSDQAMWLDRLETEHDNLRSALDWGAMQADKPTELRLASKLWRFWSYRGHWSECRCRLENILARRDLQDRTTDYCQTLFGLGVIMTETGEPGAGRVCFEQSLAISRSIADLSYERESLKALGTVAHVLGESDASRIYLEQALTVSREMTDRHAEAPILGALGAVALTDGDLASARHYLEQALAISREVGDRIGEDRGLYMLGTLSRVQGEWATARSYFSQALEISREVGTPSCEACNLVGLGAVAIADGDLVAARSSLDRALAISREVGDSVTEARVLTLLGSLVRAEGDWTAARTFYTQSLSLKRRLDSAASFSWTLEEVAALAMVEGLQPRAVRLLGAAEAAREAHSRTLWFEQQVTREKTLADARDSLGEAAFAAAWAEGNRMTLDQAVDYALSDYS